MMCCAWQACHEVMNQLAPLPSALPAGTANPQAYLSACLRPLLSGPGLSRHQGELLGGSLKAAVPPPLLPDVLAAACPPVGSGASSPQWSEHTVGVLQAALAGRPALGAESIAQLAGACAAAAVASAELAKHAKYAKLVLSLVKQYPAEAAAAKAPLAAAAAAAASFMGKPLQAAVAKL